jgi:glycosyltransferase involved in cell wall biosynthesis
VSSEAVAGGRPQVSVVLIFLNAASFLEEAIASVVAQSFTEWELLLVDDGSTDASTAIALRWAAARPDQVRYVEHPGHGNLGMSAARNLGLREARAELVTFLDADDVLRPPALQALVAVLASEPRVCMAYAPLEYWYSWKDTREGGPRDFVQPLGVPTGSVIEPPELLSRFLARQAAVPSGIIVRVDAARRVGGFEETFRGMYEDQAFCAKLCLRWPVATGRYAGYRYRQHPESSSARADRSGHHEFGREDFLSWLQNYLSKEGCRDAALLSTVRREIWWLKHPRLQRLVRRLRRVIRRIVQRIAPSGDGSGITERRPLSSSGGSAAPIGERRP